MEVELFLAGGFKEVFVIKDKVQSVDGFRGEAYSDAWCFLYKYGVGGSKV